MNTLLRHARNLGSRFFYRFGLHCSKYTIRVLIISGVVITSLTYPALAIKIYSQPLSHFSTRIFDALFVSSLDHPAAYITDIRNIWEGYDDLRIREDATAHARCGIEQTIAIERILIAGTDGGYGPLTKPTLLSALQLHRDLDAVLRTRDYTLECVHAGNDDDCLSIFPLSGWTDEQVQDMSDDQILQALNTPLRVRGVPVHINSVLAGHTLGAEYVTDPEYVVLNYFLQEDDCHGNTRHHAWLRTLREVAGAQANILPLSALPELVAVQYDTNHSKSWFSPVSALLYLTYAIVFMHFSGSLKRMETVHSRYGLAFTGLVEILASTLTSLSVCAIWGFRVTMIPWGILPIVIVFVGAENMFSLVEAVVSTPITLPVRERISIGLSRSGTSNSLKVFTYNIILGTIAFFAAGAIRQFCIFAIVVLVAHWFLIHTLFLPVLVIDLRRLDLNDLIRQDASKPVSPTQVQSTRSKTLKPKRLSTKVESLLRGRAATNGSLLLMLAITGALYYTTYSLPSRENDLGPSSSTRFATNTTATHPLPSMVDSPASQIWQLLNPSRDFLLHVRIDPPTVLTFTAGLQEPQDTHLSKRRSSSRFYDRVLAPMAQISKIIIFPIVVTNSILYLLLLFLLKDADLLEAQRHREDSDGTQRPTIRPIIGDVSFTTLERGCASDVDIIASNRDASVIASVSIDNELAVWLSHWDTHISIECSGILGGDDLMTSVAVDDTGSYCAVGTANGAIVIWSVVNGVVALQARSTATNSQVSKLAFIAANIGTRLQSAVIILCEDGEAFQWAFISSASPTSLRDRCLFTDFRPTIDSGSSQHSARLVLPAPYNSIEVLTRSANSLDWRSTLVFQIGDDSDTVLEVFAESMHVGPNFCSFIVAVTDLSQLILCDGDTGVTLATIDDLRGTIDHIRLTPSSTKSCATCGESPSDGVTLAVSSRQSVHVYRISFPSLGKRCTCISPDSIPLAYNGQPRERIQSRRASIASSASGSSSPARAPARLPVPNGPSSSSAADYPVSGHGIHTRRPRSRHGPDGNGSSDLNEPPQMFTLPIPPMTTPSDVTPSSLTYKCTKIGVIPCDRGSWDICGSLIAGVRRRARPPQGSENGENTASVVKTGLTPPVLSRWELWTFDPGEGINGVRSSSLLTLQEATRGSAFFARSPERPPSSQTPYHRLPFTRVTPLLSTSGAPRAVAGFGNTLGVFKFPTAEHIPSQSSSRRPSLTYLAPPPSVTKPNDR